MSSAYTPTPHFRDAAAYLSSAPSLSKVSNSTKLELYGLFKYLTTSQTPNTSRPGLLDFTGRAKWDAWSNIGKQFADRAPDVEARYIQIATELGWKPGETSAAPGKTTEETSSASKDEDIWDKDAGSRASGGPSGLGNSVSTVSQAGEEERQQGTLHALAVSGDVQGIGSFLQSHPETQLNEKDAYGYTALHLASDRGHLAVVKLLLERGADPRLQDADELTAVELARIAEHDDVVALIESKQ
ncbi:acyl-CoA-binding domain-containing protein [Phanerochaete sordida]|uniref:Acyl-CoA-binding domain-containing protein n=1 Tax=Phanerochaete sordida TaxID=48140 RepID=A0A9P3L8P4_9APHY|nr:acyl-CoA-binding domain-containing protein [Phanerochaete sordida]